MPTPLYPKFEKRIGDAIEGIIRQQVNPWSFFKQGVAVSRFDGRTISISGVTYEGSARDVFWRSRYIEPFIEDLAVTELTAAAAQATEREVDGMQLLSEVEGLLLSGTMKVLNRMAVVDRKLRGNGNPESVPLRSIDSEYSMLEGFIHRHSTAEKDMWREKPKLQRWHDSNTARIWLISSLLAVAGLVLGVVTLFF